MSVERACVVYGLAGYVVGLIVVIVLMITGLWPWSWLS